MSIETTPLLEADEVRVQFNVRGHDGRRPGVLHAVDGVSLRLWDGETVGVVGESGCGKSTLARALVGLVKPTSGTVRFRGADIWGKGESGRQRRRKLQMVFQNPAGSLDPRFTVGASVAEPLRAQGVRDTRARLEEMLGLVGLQRDMAVRMPHELSGGQQQRACIARALIAEPAVVVHDESVGSLDVSLQAQIVNLLIQLQDRLGVAYVFISHDLALIQAVSHRVAVMYLGEIVELGPTSIFSSRPSHPYSIALQSASLVPDPVIERTRADILLQGDVPSPLSPPSGCRFRTRCPLAAALCEREKPPTREWEDGHFVACHFAGQPLPVPDTAMLSRRDAS
jgi:oligopeptide transport system ATP-binding protein